MLGIFADAAGTQEFTNLGEMVVGEVKKVSFWIKNTGNHAIRNLNVITTYPDTTIEGAAPYQLTPGQSAAMKVIWKPGAKSLELKNRGEDRKGQIRAEGMEVF